MAHLRHRLLLALALLFVCPLPVVAFEILELNGGSISWTSDNANIALVNITGPRIGISNEQQQVNFGYNFRCTAPGFGSNCLPGTVLQVGGGGGGGDFLGGSDTLDGIPHYMSGQGFPWDAMALAVSASVLIPEFGSIESVVLSAPFVLTGELLRSVLDCFPDAYVCTGDIDITLSTTYELRGQGVFRGAMHRVNSSTFGDYWQSDAFEFDLQPTPEPATLLLWGTSAAALGVVRWRRRRAHTTTKADSG